MTTTQSYLEAVLRGQDMEGTEELESLREERARVEALVRDNLETTPTIRYGGSKAKGTMNREAYDLDLICYLDHDDDAAGETLAEIYTTIREILETEYIVEPKRSALRLRGKEPEDYNVDFHIDVVPGRYIDDSCEDCFIHQENAEKGRLKTNLDLHIAHVRQSGVVPAIRLLKLWNARRGLGIKQFVWELLIIDLLRDAKESDLAGQMTSVWEAISAASEPIAVEDPANPSGNDLAEYVAEHWDELNRQATTTLRQVEDLGWEAVFGPVSEDDDEGTSRSARIGAAAGAVPRPTRPWSMEE